MQCARNGDARGAREAMDDMVAAGLRPGPRSFHGLIVAHTLAGDEHGAMQSLRKEVSLGLRPLEETFVALARLFGSKGYTMRGEEILAAMEKFKFDIRRTWLVLVEELHKAGHLRKANEVFLKGAEGGLRGTDKLYDLLIEENCKAGDHSNALTIARDMESHGRMATTFHFNCLLSVQATCGIPEIAASTFENMQYGEGFMKPDTETYNWVIQAHTRASSGDRFQEVIDLLGCMVEDYQRVQPNAKTYRLLVEYFTKYCAINEAMRHFRALKHYPGEMKVLHDNGKNKDPLSLYLRALCREGRAVELLEALEAMERDNQPIAPRAMIVNRKGRTLVSSWIEPLQQEAELGFDVDYIARYIAEGGLTGERRRWVPRGGTSPPIDPDCEGFFYSYPIETSYKQRCFQNWKAYNIKLLKKLRNEGVHALGAGAKVSDVARVIVKLKKNIISDDDLDARKPKAASKMLVFELKEELEAQDLPTDGNRQVLYQRVQKQRRIKRSRGQRLWVPPIHEEEEVDDELEELISQLQANHANDHTEYWRKQFLYFTGELDEEDGQQVQLGESTGPIPSDVNHEKATEANQRTENENTDEDEDEDQDEVDEDEEEALGGGDTEPSEPPKLLGLQLLNGGETPTVAPKQVPPNKSMEIVQKETDEEWYIGWPVEEKFKLLKSERRFDVSEMYTIEDAWGWTWENERRAKVPETWTQEKEVDIAMKIMEKVIELGGTPTIGDCAMVLRAAIRAPLPPAMVSIFRKAHVLGYVFGSPLYDEVITLCVDLGERDAAIAIAADLEAAGINVPDETLDKVLHEKPIDESDMQQNDPMDEVQA